MGTYALNDKRRLRGSEFPHFNDALLAMNLKSSISPWWWEPTLNDE
jgi:hypothetical protein